MNKKVAAAVITGVMCMVPFMASAQTGDAQSQIQALLAQIETLKARIMEIAKSSGTMMGNVGTSTKPMWAGDDRRPCLAVKAFKVGERGEEIKELQKMMKEEKFMSADATGFFGELSKKAFKKFQEKHGKKPCGMGDMMGADMMMGTTTAVNANVITILNRNGESKSFAIASTTKVDKAVPGSQPVIGVITDVTVGEFVGIRFKKEADGTMTAMLIMRGIPHSTPKPMMQGGQGMMKSWDDDRGRGDDDRSNHY